MIDIKCSRVLYGCYQSIDSISEIIIKYLGKVKVLKNQTFIEHNNAINNLFALVCLNAIGGVLMLFTQVKMANVMGPIVYGLYSYYCAIGEIGANFVRYGRNKTMVRELVQNEGVSINIIKNTFGLGILNLFIFLLFSVLFYKQLDITLTSSCILLLIGPCLISLDFQPVYEKEHLMGWQSFYYFIQKIIFIVPIWLVALMSNHISLSLVAILYTGSWLIILILQCTEVGRAYSIQFWRLKDLLSVNKIWPLYKENFIITLCCFGGVAFGPLLRMILKSYDSETAVGIFSAGLQLMIMARFILLQISRIGNPRMAEVCKKDYSESSRMMFIKKYLIVVVAAVIPFSLLFILFPNFMVELFFSKEYDMLKFLLPIFAIDLIFNSVGVVFTQFLISLRRDSIYFTIYVLSSILAIIIAILVIPKYGVIGAAIAYCLSDTLSCIAFLIYSVKILKYSVHE